MQRYANPTMNCLAPDLSDSGRTSTRPGAQVRAPRVSPAIAGLMTKTPNVAPVVFRRHREKRLRLAEPLFHGRRATFSPPKGITEGITKGITGDLAKKVSPPRRRKFFLDKNLKNRGDKI